MTSLNPAKRFGLFPQKGHLEPGADADFIVVDLEKEWTFTKQDLLSQHRLSPYIGAKFKGAVLSTYVRGRQVYADGAIQAEPGSGNVLRRSGGGSFFN